MLGVELRRVSDARYGGFSVRSFAHGFTRVEMTVVASVMGFFAAFAIPRFTSIENQGRVAAVAALSNSIRNASSLAHAQWIASGKPATIEVEGRVISMLNGYPDAVSSGLPLAVPDTAGFSSRVVPGAVVYRKSGAPIPDQCSIVYSPASPDTPPRILLQTPSLSGC